ncbi:hypothetical protein ABIA30_004320 [Mycobacterium sp. MAA66]|uniref:hypothetical protein n=1 Tax=Mycobacterium sp. MAA66 TaxID=3156297 RepID=UPI0035188099
MPEADTLNAKSEIIRDEPVEITAEVVSIDEVAEPKRTLAIRQVLTRQLDAGQGLTGELLGAATEISALLAHSPATVINEIQDGATLPEALHTTRDGLADELGAAGSRIRSAVGQYVNTQAVLPNTVVSGGADVAGAVLRARGSVVDAAVGAAFNLARIAAQGGDVREGFTRERGEVVDRATAARTEVDAVVSRARQEITDAAAPLYTYDTEVAVTAG